MKKFISIFVISVLVSLLSGCQMCTRKFGGSSTIELPKGEKLVMATFKESNIWYLTEKMDSDYVPKTRTMYESSLMGMLEGQVTFVESK